MASKRVLRIFSLETPSQILRSQCTAQRHMTARIRSHIHSVPRPQIALAQRRWQSSSPLQSEGKKSTKIYEFEDIQNLSQASASSSSSPSSSKALLIDVREPHEYDPAHIPSAINIPITSQPDALLLSPQDFEDRFGFQKPDLGREVVFYCKAGVRSRFAAELAKRAGYTVVGEYRGSWSDWVKRGGGGEMGT